MIENVDRRARLRRVAGARLELLEFAVRETRSALASGLLIPARRWAQDCEQNAAAVADALQRMLEAPADGE